MEYRVDQKELTRRKIAFTTLIVSTLAGFAVFFHLMTIEFQLVQWFLLALAAVAGLSWWLLWRFFRLYAQSALVIGEHELKREGIKAIEQWPLEQIRVIHIRRTTRGLIRDLKITLQSGQTIYLNAINDIEKLKEGLVKQCGEGVTVDESKEHIDYDHPLFYAFLGLAVSGISVWLIRVLLVLDAAGMRYVSWAISLFAVAMGTYLIVTRPLSKYYGNKRSRSDHALGFILMAAGVGVFLLVK